jgi:hypothetical protein
LICMHNKASSVAALCGHNPKLVGLFHP